MLIAASYYSIVLSQRIEKKIKNHFRLNIFLEDSLTTESVEKLMAEINGKRFSSDVKFINKEAAAETFIKDTGEDFRKILDYNPLPASLLLTLKAEYVEKDSIEIIIRELGVMAGVDEIVFESDVLQKLVTVLERLQKYIFILTAVLILISIYISYSTIKLVISLKNDEFETMKLVGAKLSTIKMPIIFNELLTGLSASIVSSIIIYYSFVVLKTYYPDLYEYHPPVEVFGLIMLIGPVMSILVSVFVLRKINLKI